VAPDFCIHVANVRRKAWKFTAVVLSRFGSPFFRSSGGSAMMPARIAAGTITSRS
jgi:hypothetical protein